MFHVPERHRITEGRFGSDASYGNNGAFEFASRIMGSRMLMIIASDGEFWEHVSCHVESPKSMFTPTWDEMCQVKNAFWDAEDCVMQLHPPKSDYVNNHPNVLHLWRPINQVIPLPPSILVGIKGVEFVEKKWK